ncbi:MAG: redox-sensing transcriptional repressor Rex [Acutalibacteraceae bacterium]|nr:redox-sensing transcriptional repressor Rex [Clostridia bacterium]MEE0981979.1 redox-sensing transcriptional repressor Rex [Acutalibacteraceae bacterium]
MPKEKKDISMSVIKRLPRYYRFLGELKKKNVSRISSRELSQMMGFTASQIRQDLNCFGGFGQQGYGYNVDQLRTEIGSILGVGNGFKTIIIGCGNLGKAIAAHMAFEDRGFELVGIFDKRADEMQDVRIKGISISPIEDLEIYCKEVEPIVAVLCTPTLATPEIVDRLINLGITNFWNFSHYDINSVYPQANVENVHLNDSLMTLSYQITNNGGVE